MRGVGQCRDTQQTFIFDCSVNGKLTDQTEIQTRSRDIFVLGKSSKIKLNNMMHIRSFKCNVLNTVLMS